MLRHKKVSEKKIKIVSLFESIKFSIFLTFIIFLLLTITYLYFKYSKNFEIKYIPELSLEINNNVINKAMKEISLFYIDYRTYSLSREKVKVLENTPNSEILNLLKNRPKEENNITYFNRLTTIKSCYLVGDSLMVISLSSDFLKNLPEDSQELGYLLQQIFYTVYYNFNVELIHFLNNGQDNIRKIGVYEQKNNFNINTFRIMDIKKSAEDSLKNNSIDSLFLKS